jgi:hypothetical protein
MNGASLTPVISPCSLLVTMPDGENIICVECGFFEGPCSSRHTVRSSHLRSTFLPPGLGKPLGKAKQSEAKALLAIRWRVRADTDYESMSLWVWSEQFTTVVRDPQGLVQVRIIKDVPETSYDLSVNLRLIRNHLLDLPQHKCRKCVAAALQCRPSNEERVAKTHGTKS